MKKNKVKQEENPGLLIADLDFENNYQKKQYRKNFIPHFNKPSILKMNKQIKFLKINDVLNQVTDVFNPIETNTALTKLDSLQDKKKLIEYITRRRSQVMNIKEIKSINNMKPVFQQIRKTMVGNIKKVEINNYLFHQESHNHHQKDKKNNKFLITTPEKDSNNDDDYQEIYKNQNQGDKNSRSNSIDQLENQQNVIQEEQDDQDNETGPGAQNLFKQQSSSSTQQKIFSDNEINIRQLEEDFITMPNQQIRDNKNENWQKEQQQQYYKQQHINLKLDNNNIDNSKQEMELFKDKQNKNYKKIIQQNQQETNQGVTGIFKYSATSKFHQKELFYNLTKVQSKIKDDIFNHQQYMQHVVAKFQQKKLNEEIKNSDFYLYKFMMECEKKRFFLQQGYSYDFQKDKQQQNMQTLSKSHSRVFQSFDNLKSNKYLRDLNQIKTSYSKKRKVLTQNKSVALLIQQDLSQF